MGRPPTSSTSRQESPTDRLLSEYQDTSVRRRRDTWKTGDPPPTATPTPPPRPSSGQPSSTRRATRPWIIFTTKHQNAKRPEKCPLINIIYTANFYTCCFSL